MQPVAGDAVERCVVQHHHAVRALRQPFQREERVVWLDYYVTVDEYKIMFFLFYSRLDKNEIKLTQRPGFA